MNVAQLKAILLEYPGSRALRTIVRGQTLQEMTVIEMIIKLMNYETDGHEQILKLFGLENCIVRERYEFTDRVSALASPCREWIELDLR